MKFPRLLHMEYGLPTAVEIDGKDRDIRADFRVILTIIQALNDPDLDDSDRAEAMITLFYPEYDDIQDVDAAVKRCIWFIDGGNTEKKNDQGPRLVDWEKDYQQIIAPVNRVLGYEARAVPYDFRENTGGLHWWSFIAAYMEMGGDCVYSNIISIRDKKARGKKLEKHEREWYRRNRAMVDIETKYSDEQEALLKEWT